MIGIERGEESHGLENIFNKIIEENFPNLKNEVPIKVQETYKPRYNRLEKKSPQHRIIKTLNIENKGRLLKAIKENDQAKYKGKPIRIIYDFSMETLKSRKV